MFRREGGGGYGFRVTHLLLMSELIRASILQEGMNVSGAQ